MNILFPKPLFLKELKKLWSKVGVEAFNESNTLLLDNHDEKFEGSPLGACLVVSEWKFNMEGAGDDNVLSLKSSLVQHLCKLAKVEKRVYEAYVQEQEQNMKGRNSLGNSVPTFVPTPQVPTWSGSGGGGNSATSVTRSTSESSSVSTNTNTSMTSRSSGVSSGGGGGGGRHAPNNQFSSNMINMCLKSFCASPLHRSLNPAYSDWTRYAKARDSPGPRALPFQREVLLLLIHTLFFPHLDFLNNFFCLSF
jgi:hypothetical protein